MIRISRKIGGDGVWVGDVLVRVAPEFGRGRRVCLEIMADEDFPVSREERGAPLWVSANASEILGLIETGKIDRAREILSALVGEATE